MTNGVQQYDYDQKMWVDAEPLPFYQHRRNPLAMLWAFLRGENPWWKAVK